MTYIFRLITGSLDVRLDFDLPITSTSLLDAVRQVKRYIADNFDVLVVISYWYLVQFDDGTLLPRCMSDSFYEKNVLEDN